MKRSDFKFPLGSIVEIFWRDASSRSGWATLEEYSQHGPAVCTTVGYLMRNSQHDVLVAQTQSDDQQALSGMSIPKEWCVSLKLIGRANAKQKAKPRRKKPVDKAK